LEIEIDCLILQMVRVLDCLLVQISDELGLNIPLHQISIDRSKGNAFYKVKGRDIFTSSVLGPFMFDECISTIIVSILNPLPI
jgi:hypothetical protein